jgi:hypothetical protein
MRVSHLLWCGLLLGAAAPLATGTGAPGRETARSSPMPPPAAIAAFLLVSPEAPALAARPALADRLRRTPHNYFRFVNRPFSDAVCRLFADVRGSLPDVNLHGDAHVEQYAVTSLAHGLTDFDDSARGPYVVDLVRFGVSLDLAARERGWADADGAIDALLRGYRDALSDPAREHPPERTIRRARAGFAFDHALALRRAETTIESDPVPPSDLEGDFQSYVARMYAEAPSLPSGFFHIKKAGRLASGIGSALDEKYLLRIEGWTDGDGDDRVLEAKLVHPLVDTECLRADAGAERVPLGMSRIARVSFAFSGLFVHGQRTLWVHAWTDDYAELSIETSFPEPRDLREVAYDVGTQLARAHPNGNPGDASPSRLRALLLESTSRNERRIRRAIDQLTEATVDAWHLFRGDTPEASPWPARPGSGSAQVRPSG